MICPLSPAVSTANAQMLCNCPCTMLLSKASAIPTRTAALMSQINFSLGKEGEEFITLAINYYSQHFMTAFITSSLL